MVTDVTAVGSPDIAERAILGEMSARRLSDQFSICVWGAILWCRSPLLSPDNFTQDYLMKKELLVADVTIVGSLDRPERAIWGVIYAGRFFLPIQAVFVIREPLFDAGNPS